MKCEKCHGELRMKDLLKCAKAWVQILMEIGIKNLVYMVFSLLP